MEGWTLRYGSERDGRQCRGEFYDCACCGCVSVDRVYLYRSKRHTGRGGEVWSGVKT